jgi:hypothetical protein
MFENPVEAWDRHKDVVGLNWLMGFHPSPLDPWISNDNSYKNERKQKPAHILFYRKRPYTIRKIKCQHKHGQYEYINMCVSFIFVFLLLVASVA